MSRLQKEDDHKSSGGTKHSDLPSKYLGSSSFINSPNKQQNDVAIDSFRYSDGTLKLHMDATSHEDDLKGIVSEPTTENRRASTSDIPDPKIRKSSQMGLNQPFASVKAEANHAVFDCTIPTQCSWSEVPKRPLEKEQKTLVQLKDSFSQLPLNGTQHHFQVDQSQSVAPVSSNPSVTQEVADYKSDYISPVNSRGSAVDNFPIQSKSLMVNDQSPDLVFTSNLGLKTHGFDLGCISDPEFYQRNLLLGGEVASAPLEEDFRFFLLQGDCYNVDFGLQNIEMSQYYDPRLIAEVPTQLFDSADYSAVDQSLFIA